MNYENRVNKLMVENLIVGATGVTPVLTQPFKRESRPFSWWFSVTGSDPKVTLRLKVAMRNVDAEYAYPVTDENGLPATDAEVIIVATGATTCAGKLPNYGVPWHQIEVTGDVGNGADTKVSFSVKDEGLSL